MNMSNITRPKENIANTIKMINFIENDSSLVLPRLFMRASSSDSFNPNPTL